MRIVSVLLHDAKFPIIKKADMKNTSFLFLVGLQYIQRTLKLTRNIFINFLVGRLKDQDCPGIDSHLKSQTSETRLINDNVAIECNRI